MSRFIIPSGPEYVFTVIVYENDSFIPQDLATMTAATFTLTDPADGDNIVGAAITGVAIGDDQAWYNDGDTEKVNPYPDEQTAIEDEANDASYTTEATASLLDTDGSTYYLGKIQFTLPDTYTQALDVSAKGDAVDWYYLKPRYHGHIKIEFSDISDKYVKINKVYVSKTGA